MKLLSGVAAIVILSAPAVRAQMAFDVASVKPSKGAFVPSNVPLTPDDDYSPIDGLFRADAPLRVFIEFAYKLWPNDLQSRELSRLPKWAESDRYTIEARTARTNLTKDQIRLMVQSLLVDRFQLTTHLDSREVPVFELKFAKAGKPGPKLVNHSDGPACDNRLGFPAVCHELIAIDVPDTRHIMVGARDVSMDILAGRFDFTLEWAPAHREPVPSDLVGPTPGEALRDQLGQKLEPVKASLPILVIDRVERPSEN